MGDFKLIEKENVSKLNFPTQEVLTDKEIIKERLSDLERVTVLGNAGNIKVELFFEDSSEKYVVNTTVWGVTDKRVILKQGITIPINRILKVSY